MRQFARTRSPRGPRRPTSTRRVSTGRRSRRSCDGAAGARSAGGVRRRGRATSSPRRSPPRSWPGSCASTSLMFLISKLAMLPVINFGSEELKRTYLPAGREWRVAGRLLPVRGRRRQRRRLDDHAGGPRRRRLRAHRHEGVDHQRRHLRPLHGVRQDRSERRAPGHQRVRGREGLGRAGRRSSSTSWASRARRPGSRAFDEVRVPATQPHRRGGRRASLSRCTRSTGPVRPSAPRPWASPRARSTTRSAT